MQDCLSCTDGFCVVRNRSLARSMQTTCRNGNAAAVDRLLVLIDTNRAIEASKPKHRREVRLSPPKPVIVSDFGTRLLKAIEAAGGDGYRVKCGHCRNYLAKLNQQTTHDRVAIVTDIQWELPIPEFLRSAGDVKQARSDWLRGIVASVYDDIERNARDVSLIDRYERRGFA